MFSETVRLAARGHRVHLVVLGEFQFTDATKYLHNEGGILRSRGATGAIEAISWQGLQGNATISGLGASKVGASRQVTCALDAEDAQIKEFFFEAEQRSVAGQIFRFWGQFYDQDLNPLDPRFHIYTGIGDRLRMSKTGSRQRRVELMLEDYFARRRRSAGAMVTHADQQARDPGSTGLIFVAQMIDKTLNLYDARD